MNEDTSALHPPLGSGAACSHSFAAVSDRVVGARPADHGGPRLGVRLPPLEQDGGVPLCGALRGALGGAPAAPFSRPLLAHYLSLPRGHGAATDDPPWEKGGL